MSTQPALMSAAFIEREARVLAAHRKSGRRPFGGQWLLPMTLVGGDETAEEAVRRHATETFGVTVANEIFADTVYVEDPDDQARYVANVFRTELADAALRFNSDGDYDDARWLSADELPDVWMPPPLRESLIRLLTEPPMEEMPEWPSPAASGEALPLAERETAAMDVAAPPPDNRATWNEMAKTWRDERYGEGAVTQLMWKASVSEQDLQLLDDVRGQHALVLGCGGGQDVVALDRLGAIAVGIDYAPAQILHARKLATKHASVNASFVEGQMEDLSRFDDGRFDLVLAINVLEYVARIDVALAEVARVLRPGGSFIVATPHPFAAVADDVTASGASYWSPYFDAPALPDAGSPLFRTYTRTMSEWIDQLSSAGFVLDRLVEPPDGYDDANSGGFDSQRTVLMPDTLILKARKR